MSLLECLFLLPVEHVHNKFFVLRHKNPLTQGRCSSWWVYKSLILEIMQLCGSSTINFIFKIIETYVEPQFSFGV